MRFLSSPHGHVLTLPSSHPRRTRLSRTDSNEARRQQRYSEAEQALAESLRAPDPSTPEAQTQALRKTASLLQALSEDSGEAARHFRAVIAARDLHGPPLRAAKRERWLLEHRQRQCVEQAARLERGAPPASPAPTRRQVNLARFLEASGHRPMRAQTLAPARRMVAGDAEDMLTRGGVRLPPPGVFLRELTARRRCSDVPSQSAASASVSTLPTASTSSLLTDEGDASASFMGLVDDNEEHDTPGSVIVYCTPKRTHRSRQSICRGLGDLPLPDYARELLEGFAEDSIIALQPLVPPPALVRSKHASLPPPAREEHPFPQLSPPRDDAASRPDARRRAQSSVPTRRHRPFLSLENASVSGFMSMRTPERPRRQKLRSLFSIAETHPVGVEDAAERMDTVERPSASGSTRKASTARVPNGLRVSSEWSLVRAASRSEMLDREGPRLRRKPSITSRLMKRMSLQLSPRGKAED